MMLMAYTFLLYIQRRAQVIITMQTRDAIQTQLLQNLSDYRTIKKSRLLDPVFDSCFLGGNKRSTCPGQQNTGISIHHVSGTLLAGPPDHPAYFTFLGAPCTWPNSNCVLKVSSYVYAQGVPYWEDGSLVSVRGWDLGNEVIEIRFTVAIVNMPGMNLRDLTGSMFYDLTDVLDNTQDSN